MSAVALDTEGRLVVLDSFERVNRQVDRQSKAPLRRK